MLSDLTSSQKALAEYMSELSERAYSAGWMKGLEFVLWRAVVHGPFKYGRLELTCEHAQHLAALSENCGGWIFFHAEREEVFFPLNEWLRLVASSICAYDLGR